MRELHKARIPGSVSWRQLRRRSIDCQRDVRLIELVLRIRRNLLGSGFGIWCYREGDQPDLISEAWMNLPGVPSGYWKWRMKQNAASKEIAATLKELATLYDR